MALASDFQTIFNKMQDGSKDDDYFADEIGKKIKAFVSGCTLVVAPSPLVGADSSPAGTFSGSATVSWATQGTPIASALKALWDDMRSGDKSDDDLAQAFGDGLDDDAPTWTVSISGNTTVPGSPPVVSPSADSGSVTATFNSSTVVSGLKACFAAMKKMKSGGDDYFAAQLGSLVTAYYTSAIVTFQGATHLSGVAGTITVVAGA